MLTNYSICWHSNWSKAIWQVSRYGWFIFSIFQLNSQCQSDQCWRKFATLAIFYKYLVILLGLVSIWQHFEYTLAIFFLGVGQNFIVVKVQILKNDLTIWSHCSKCLKGICFKVAFTLRQIKLRKMFDFCWIFFLYWPSLPHITPRNTLCVNPSRVICFRTDLKVPPHPKHSKLTWICSPCQTHTQWLPDHK